MENSKQEIVNTVRNIQWQRRLNVQVAKELDALSKDIDKHFKETIFKIEKAQAR